MTLQEAQTLLAEAMDADLEGGSAWMSDRAWKEFREKYPRIYAAISKITEEEDE